MPNGFQAHAHLDFSLLQLAIKPLSFTVVVHESLLSAFFRLGIYKRDLLHARVIVTSLYLVCVCPIRSLCVSGELDRVSAGCRAVESHWKPGCWVSRLLSELQQEVIVAHARNVRLIGESGRKDDRFDARTLARLARIDPSLVGQPGGLRTVAQEQPRPADGSCVVPTNRLGAQSPSAEFR
jgi:hypothetical protein